jgi:hypothetical protein
LPEGLGYSAFIRSRDLDTDEVLVKLVWRPATWLRTSISYQLVATDYQTVTDPVIINLPSIPPFTYSPGGLVFAGNYDANIYSLNATLTPWRRVYLYGTFSYQQTRTSTAQNDIASVVPYDGEVFTLLSNIRYILNEKTDLTAGYNYSWADYGQGNEADGLPVGMVYSWHGATAGVTRRLKKNVTISSQYRFYYYDEPSSGGANNYIAHGVFAALNWVLR